MGELGGTELLIPPPRSNSPILNEGRTHRELEAYLKSTSSSASEKEQGEVKDVVERVKRRNEALVEENRQLAIVREKLYIEKDKLAMKMSTTSRECARYKLAINDLKKELNDT